MRVDDLRRDVSVPERLIICEKERTNQRSNFKKFTKNLLGKVLLRKIIFEREEVGEFGT